MLELNKALGLWDPHRPSRGSAGYSWADWCLGKLVPGPASTWLASAWAG